ncbi:MAG: hypothetical protein E4G98_00190 [Promethearchaeota archaeon]|nr:MAG: hypothetical protein E4G98_00190 [Candidatus Lokiarchaeota archaeon]
MNWDNYTVEEQIEITQAMELIEEGLSLGHTGDIRGATFLVMRAIEIYLNAALYLRISPAFNQLITLVQKESEILLIMEKVQDIIVELEYLELREEIGKLKLVLAVLAYKQGNYLEASMLYTEIAEIFFTVDPDEYRQASAMFLIRAGECLEKIGRLERAENAIFQAIHRMDTSIFDYSAHFAHLIHLIGKKKYEKAIEELREIAGFFRQMRQELEKVEEFSDVFAYLKNNVLARLFHMISEFNLLKMMCYRFCGEEEKVQEQAKKSVEDLRRTIAIVKEELRAEHYSTADLHRVTFDLFLLQLFQEFAAYQVEDPLDLVLRGVPEYIQKILRKMQFFRLTEHIVEVDLRHAMEIFDDVPLSAILDPFREFLIQAIHLE